MNMRKRKRKKSRFASANVKQRLWERRIADSKTAKAGNYILHLEKLITSKQRLKVLLYCRVSRCWQKKTGNLVDQQKYLRRKIRQYERKNGVKIIIIAVFEDVASGWNGDRKVLIAATQEAKKCGVVLVAESTCRFIRNENYHYSCNSYVLPTVCEYSAVTLNRHA